MARGPNPGSGPIVPRDILRRTDLFPVDKLVYAYVVDAAAFFARDGNVFRKAADTIAKHVGVDERTVRRSLRRLEAAHLLAVDHKPGRPAVVAPTPDTVPDLKSQTPDRMPDVTDLNPGQDARPTPDRMPDHPGHGVRGTPDRMPDDRTTVTNYQNDLPQRPVVWGSEEIEAEKSRIRRCWIQARDPDENTNGRGLSLRDQQAAHHAATERLVVDLDDTTLRTMMGEKRLFLKASGYESGLPPVLNNLRRPNEIKSRRMNGKPPIPPRREGDPFGYDELTGRPYHPGV